MKAPAKPAVRPVVELLETVAEAPGAVLYRAHDRGLDRDVFVREIRAAEGSAAMARAAAWQALGPHPHVVRCLGARSAGGSIFVEIEAVHGSPLGQWWGNGRRLSAANALNLAIQILHALRAAHASGLAHGALHPGNILVDGHGFAFVTDFDAADRRRPFPEDERNLYVAPESWVAGNVAPPADLFALGVLLFRLLEGKEPFASTRGLARPARRPQCDCPERVSRLLAACLEWDARARPRAEEALAELCAGYAEHTGLPSPFAQPPPSDPAADAGNDAGAWSLAQGDGANAVRCWERAVRGRPGHPEATYNLACHYWRRAEMSDREVLAWLSPEHPPAEWRWRLAACRALVHVERGDLAAVSEALRELRLHAPFGAVLDDVARRCEAEPGEALPPLGVAGDTGALSGLAIAPDGSWVAAGGADGIVRLWDARTGELIRCLEGHEASITAVAAAGQDGLVLSAAEDGTVRIWKPDGDAPEVIETAEPQVFAMAVSEDGRLAITSSGGAIGSLAVEHTTVEVWDVVRRRRIRVLQGHEAPVKAVAIDPRGVRAATGGDDHRIVVWDMRTGEALHAIGGHANHVAALAFSACGTWLASGSWDQTVRLWHAATGRELHRFAGHEGVVTAVAVSPDRRHVLSGGWDQTVRVWDVADGRCLRTFEGHRGMVAAVSLAGDGRTVASASWDGSVCVWRIAPRPLRLPPRLVPRVRYAELPSTTGPAEMLRTAEQALGGGHVAAALDLLHRLQSRGHEEAALRLEERLAEICEQRGLRDAVVEHELPAAGASAVACVAGLGLVLGTRSGEIEVPREGRVFSAHREPVLALAADPSGHLLASGAADGAVCLWDPRTGDPRHTLRGHTGAVVALAVAADGGRVASASYDHTVRVWPVDDPSRGLVLGGHTRQVCAVFFLEEAGAVISAAYDGTIRVWDADSGACIRTIQGGQGPLIAAAILEDRRRIVASGLDGTLAAWDLATGAEVARAQLSAPPVTVIRPVGEWAVLVGANGVPGAWHPGASAPAFAGEADGGLVTSAALADGGLRLVTLCRDGLVRTWRLRWKLAARLSPAAMARAS